MQVSCADEVLHACSCKACHPGYGFLSENVDFVEALEGRGVAFLGPTADTMRMFSRKHTAREFAESADVPVLPGERFQAYTAFCPCGTPGLQQDCRFCHACKDNPSKLYRSRPSH